MDAKAALGVVGAGRRCAEGAGRWQRQKLVAAVLACARLKEQHSAVLSAQRVAAAGDCGRCALRVTMAL